MLLFLIGSLTRQAQLMDMSALCAWRTAASLGRLSIFGPRAVHTPHPALQQVRLLHHHSTARLLYWLCALQLSVVTFDPYKVPAVLDAWLQPHLRSHVGVSMPSAAPVLLCISMGK